MCSEDEIKIGQDEGQAHFEQVKLREKKQRSQQDPFAELLSPKATARLRWSQELNPLYDYIRGFKISDGVKLYDTTPSKLLESSSDRTKKEVSDEKTSYKPFPEVIMEEELENREDILSPSEPYSPPASDTSRPTSSFSDAMPLSPTHYTRKEHQYEEINFFSNKRDPAGPRGASLIHQMKRSVTEPAKSKGEYSSLYWDEG